MNTQGYKKGSTEIGFLLKVNFVLFFLNVNFVHVSVSMSCALLHIDIDTVCVCVWGLCAAYVSE